MPVNNEHSFQIGDWGRDEKKSCGKRTLHSSAAVNWPVHVHINWTCRPLLGQPSSSGIFINFSAVVCFRHSGLPLYEVLFRSHQLLMADLLGPNKGLVMCCRTKSPSETPVNIPYDISILMNAPDRLSHSCLINPVFFHVPRSSLLASMSLRSLHCSLVTLGMKRCCADLKCLKVEWSLLIMAELMNGMSSSTLKLYSAELKSLLRILIAEKKKTCHPYPQFLLLCKIYLPDF